MNANEKCSGKRIRCEVGRCVDEMHIALICSYFCSCVKPDCKLRGSLPHIQRIAPSPRHTETDLDCFSQVRIIARLHPLYGFRKAVKASAAGAVWFCNALQQTWPNKQMKENSTSPKTPQELLSFLESFLSLTSMKTFSFFVHKMAVADNL